MKTIITLLTVSMFLTTSAKASSIEERCQKAIVYTHFYDGRVEYYKCINDQREKEEALKNELQNMSTKKLVTELVEESARAAASCGISSDLVILSTIAESLPFVGTLLILIGVPINPYPEVGDGLDVTAIIAGGAIAVPIRTAIDFVKRDSNHKASEANYLITANLISSMDKEDAISDLACGTKIRALLAVTDELRAHLK